VEDVTAMKYVVQVEDREFIVEVEQGTVTIDGQVHAVDLRRIEPLSLYSLLVDNLSHEVFIEPRQDQYAALLRGKLYAVEVHDGNGAQRRAPRADQPVAAGEASVEAPMPGLVLEVRVSAGQSVASGDVLVVLESMKMKTDIRCPGEGTVRAVHVAPQDHVAQGQPLVDLSLS
jgi:biotin carboxyl carrier protein